MNSAVGALVHRGSDCSEPRRWCPRMRSARVVADDSCPTLRAAGNSDIRLDRTPRSSVTATELRTIKGVAQ
jgi:hypothetical protein